MLPKFNRCFATPVRDPIGSKNVGLNCVWFWVRSAPAARWREVEVDAAARARGWRIGELEWTRNPATSQSKYQRRIIRISLIIFVGGVEWILSLLPCSGWYVSHSSAPPAWPGNRGGTRLENRKKNIFSPVLFFPSCVWCWRAYMEKYTYHHYHPKLTSELFSERENTSVHFYSRNRGARITKSSHFRSHPTINMDFCIYSI